MDTSASCDAWRLKDCSSPGMTVFATTIALLNGIAFVLAIATLVASLLFRRNNALAADIAVTAFGSMEVFLTLYSAGCLASFFALSFSAILTTTAFVYRTLITLSEVLIYIGILCYLHLAVRASPVQTAKDQSFRRHGLPWLAVPAVLAAAVVVLAPVAKSVSASLASSIAFSFGIVVAFDALRFVAELVVGVALACAAHWQDAVLVEAEVARLRSGGRRGSGGSKSLSAGRAASRTSDSPLIDRCLGSDVLAALREVVTTLWWMSIGVAVLTLSHLIGTVFDVLGLDEGGFIFIRLLTTECCPFLIGSCFCAAILSRRIDLALGVGISTSSESEDMSESAGERPPPGPSPYPTFIPFVENGPTDPEPGRSRTSSVTGQDTSVGAASAVRGLYVGPSAIAQSNITPLPVYYSAPTIMAPSVRHPLFPGGFAPGYEIPTAPPSSLRRSSLPQATQQSREPPPPPPTLPQQISWLSTTRPDLVSPYFMKNMKG